MKKYSSKNYLKNYYSYFATRAVTRIETRGRVFICFFFLFFLFSLFSLSTVFAQATQKFPDWMNEVEFNRVDRSIDISTIQVPVDPSTGKAATEQSGRFRPKLPDFSKMREKAIKTGLERKAKEEKQLEESYTASIQNVDQLKKRKIQLDAILSINPNSNEKIALLEEIYQLGEKIKLSEEFIALLGVGESKKAATSLSPDSYRRAKDIQKQLFTGIQLISDHITGVTEPDTVKTITKAPLIKLTEDSTEEEIDATRLRNRRYRPGRVGVFYNEFKKERAEKKLSNGGSD